MLITILVALTVMFWVGFVFVYFKREIITWLDNRFGPDHREEKPPSGKKPFWRLYD